MILEVKRMAGRTDANSIDIRRVRLRQRAIWQSGKARLRAMAASIAPTFGARRVRAVALRQSRIKRG